MEIRNLESLNLPTEIMEDIKGIINAVNHNVGINKFLFEGLPVVERQKLPKMSQDC